MLRVVLMAEGDQRVEVTERALSLLGPKVIGYNCAEGYLVVPKLEVDAIVKALRLNGIVAETRDLPQS